MLLTISQLLTHGAMRSGNVRAVLCGKRIAIYVDGVSWWDAAYASEVDDIVRRIPTAAPMRILRGSGSLAAGTILWTPAR